MSCSPRTQTPCTAREGFRGGLSRAASRASIVSSLKRVLHAEQERSAWTGNEILSMFVAAGNEGAFVEEVGGGDRQIQVSQAEHITEPEVRRGDKGFAGVATATRATFAEMLHVECQRRFFVQHRNDDADVLDGSWAVGASLPVEIFGVLEGSAEAEERARAPLLSQSELQPLGSGTAHILKLERAASRVHLRNQILETILKRRQTPFHAPGQRLHDDGFVRRDRFDLEVGIREERGGVGI